MFPENVESITGVVRDASECQFLPSFGRKVVEDVPWAEAIQSTFSVKLVPSNVSQRYENIVITLIRDHIKWNNAFIGRNVRRPHDVGSVKGRRSVFEGPCPLGDEQNAMDWDVFTPPNAVVAFLLEVNTFGFGHLNINVYNDVTSRGEVKTLVFIDPSPCRRVVVTCF